MIIDQHNVPDNVGSPEIRPLGPCGQAKAGAGSSDPTQPQAAMATPQPSLKLRPFQQKCGKKPCTRMYLDNIQFM